jgi:hypothetical protein
MSAKVDNSLVQDNYNLYHHCTIFDEKSNWIIIQQGINESFGNARRYHWGVEHQGFIEEPQGAILCPTTLDQALNMTSKDSKNNRKTCVDIIRENPLKIKKTMALPVKANQSRLDNWTYSKTLIMPRSVNWKAVIKAYEFQPRNYQEMVSLRGIGPSTIRGLAILAELLYGDKASWKDPVRFNFAFGGKDGVPFPVDRRAMDEAVDLLKTGIKSSSLEKNAQRRALRGLRKCVPKIDPDLNTVF